MANLVTSRMLNVCATYGAVTSLAQAGAAGGGNYGGTARTNISKRSKWPSSGEQVTCGKCS